MKSHINIKSANQVADVSGKLFSIVSTFSAKRDIRFYLNAVSIEPSPDGGCMLVATNGHVLAVIPDTGAKLKRKVLIPTQCLPTLLKRSGMRLRLNEDGFIYAFCEVTHAIEWISPLVEIENAKFPDWRPLIPDPSEWIEGTTANMDPKYLGYLKVFSLLRYAVTRVFHRVNCETDDKAFFTVTAADFAAFGLIMGMTRTYTDKNPINILPSVFRTALPEKIEAETTKETA